MLERKAIPGVPTIVTERGRDPEARVDMEVEGDDDDDADADDGIEDAMDDDEGIRCSTVTGDGSVALAAASFAWRLFTFLVKDSTLFFKLLFSFISLRENVSR